MLTELDPPYESKEELKIGHTLDLYGISFLYRQATVIYDQGQNEIQEPSFTLYPYGGLVIDYVPGAGEDQKDELLRREQSYRYNQIPAVLLGPKDLTEPNWQDVLYKRIKQAYGRLEEAMNHLLGSSITYRIAVGPQQGRKVFTLQTLPDCRPENPLAHTVGKVAGFYIKAGRPRLQGCRR